MTKRQRTLLFSILLGSFLVLAPLFFLYSQGYRIDFQSTRIAQTGAFYLKANPSRVDILIDGSLIKKTDFLFGSLLTKNFFPDSYFLEVVKDGYHSWQKILPIHEQQVTEAKNILLFKEEPAFQKLADKVERFWISPDRQYALLKKSNEKKLQLLNLKTGGVESLGREISIKDEVLDVQWAQDSRRFLLTGTHREQLAIEVQGISDSQPCFAAPCALAYLGSNIGNVQFSPATPEEILFTKFLNRAQVLLKAEYVEQKLAIPITSNLIAFTSFNNNIFWLDNDGALRQRDLNVNDETQTFQESVFLPKKETEYELLIAGKAILVKEDSTLFLHERSTSERQEILSPVFEIAIDPSGNKVALANQSELWVLFLTEETEQPQRKAGELLLLTRFSEPPKNLTWIDPFYLLFSLQDIVRSIEIDTRDRTNIVDIASFPSPVFAWNNEKGTLYILSEDAFSVSEQIVR